MCTKQRIHYFCSSMLRFPSQIFHDKAVRWKTILRNKTLRSKVRINDLYKCNPSSYYLIADIFASPFPLTVEHQQLIKRKSLTGEKSWFFFFLWKIEISLWNVCNSWYAHTKMCMHLLESVALKHYMYMVSLWKKGKKRKMAQSQINFQANLVRQTIMWGYVARMQIPA